ncbi:hypothetical protein KEM54_001363 [Ascosphaera aggregata]|nr:hypothetical protein KEM54_001363 [Ascosphaera aggregata]
MADTTGAFDPTRKETSLAPPTTHQYIPAAGPPPQEEKKQTAAPENVTYFVPNVVNGQSTPGAFPMCSAPKAKSEDEKVNFAPFIPVAMQMPPQPDKELKEKEKKQSQAPPSMPAFAGGPGPAFVAPPPGFAPYHIATPFFCGGVTAPMYPMPFYYFPSQGHAAGPPTVPAAAMVPPTVQPPQATYQPVQLAPGTVPYMGATAEEVQARNHTLAVSTGASGPFTLAPYKVEAGQQFWCQELDGTWSLRTQSDIEENCKPGLWMPTATGTVAWMRTPAEKK